MEFRWELIGEAESKGTLKKKMARYDISSIKQCAPLLKT